MSYPKDGAPYLDECIIYCVNLSLSIQVRFNPKWLGGQIDPLPCGFWKNVSSKEMVKLCFFVFFRIILRHIFPKNSIEIPQVVQNKFSANISYFHQFSSIFLFFNIALLQKN